MKVKVVILVESLVISVLVAIIMQNIILAPPARYKSDPACKEIEAKYQYLVQHEGEDVTPPVVETPDVQDAPPQDDDAQAPAPDDQQTAPEVQTDDSNSQ